MSEAGDELKAKEEQVQDEPEMEPQVEVEPQAEIESETASAEEEQVAAEVEESLETATETDVTDAAEVADEAGSLVSEESDAAPEASAETDEAVAEEVDDAKKHATGIGDALIVGIIALIFGTLLCLPCLLSSQKSAGSDDYDLSGGVAASVNGVEIGENDVTAEIAKLRETQDLADDKAWGEWLVSNGYTPESLRSQILDYYSTIEVIKQAVKENNIEVPESEVDAQFAEIAEQLGGEDELVKALQEEGLTEEEYRESLKFGLQQEALAEKVVTDDLTVDDATVLSFMQMYYPDDVPEGATSLEGLNPENVEMIRTWLQDSMRQEAFSKWLEETTASAEITISDMPEGLPYAIDLTPYEGAASDLAQLMENPELTNDMPEDAPAEK